LITDTHENITRVVEAAAKQRDQELLKAEAMYKYELEALDRSVEEERALIIEDIKVSPHKLVSLESFN
jgi:hypothetical protein